MRMTQLIQNPGTGRLCVACLLLLLIGLQPGAAQAGIYQYTISSDTYTFQDAGDGKVEIKMNGFGQLLDPGKPKLPSRIFNIAIPPNTTVQNVTVLVGPGEVLPGTYEIVPSPMESPLNATEAEVAQNRADYDKVVAEAYASMKFYPDTAGNYIGRGGYRKYSLVQVRFTPFQYQAGNKTLRYYPSAAVTVEYASGAAVSSMEGAQATAAFQGAAARGINVRIPEVEAHAAEILENYDSAQIWFPAPIDGNAVDSAVGLYEFVIITTEALVDAVKPLVNYEKSKGRTVYVATTTEIQAEYPSSDLQRAIRYWLRSRYPSDQWGITNVCLVGDLNDVPMRYCHPSGSGGTSVPTDLYYAELTDMDSLSWDYNWDGYFGEYGTDVIDFVQEVNVGRIPWSDYDTVEAICEKIANYDYSSSLSGYKNNVLFNMAYFWYDTDGAVLSKYLLAESEFSDMTPYRIYERTVYNPGSTSHRWSTYTADDYMDSAGSPFVGEWSLSTNYGFVNWLGHGSSVSASYHCGDDLSCRNFIHRDNTSSLDDDYPAIVFSDSCSTAYPDVDSLGRNVMRQGGVAFVGASRTAYGSHGWNDPSDGNCESFHYEFARRVAGYFGVYTVGQAFRYALYTMYNTHNWGTSWYQMFEWTLFGNPDMRAAAAQPSLPNLDSYTRTGWAYPIVPRSTDGATSTSCPVTTTLPGNTANTYYNWSSENNGLVNSPPAVWRIYLDENWMGYTTPSIAAGASSYHINWNYGPAVTGGRHTLYYRLDEDEAVWESNETDNCWAHQFVWSPYALSDDVPIYRNAAPYSDAWGCSSGYYNNDGFSFVVGQEHPDKWWSAVGVLPSDAASDYDIRLWDIGNYTGSQAGFGSDYLEYSSNGGDVSDFVIVNDNVAAAGTYTAGAINQNNTSSNYHIEEATSTKIFAGTNSGYTMLSSAVLDIYEAYLNPPGEWRFELEQTSGTCDLGMTVYDDETVTASKSEYMSGGYANSNGDGEGEVIQLTIPDEGFHSLVVWKADSSDYTKSTTYRIKMGLCTTPGEFSGPVPANGATGVSVDTDLDWADSDYTEYYEVWLNDGSGWIMQGETETSSWTLGTLNEATYYEWFVRAYNLCGATRFIYWNFTTEDTTPPSPDPMTWGIEPYETSISAISMEASEATDPTAPVNYFFEFFASPTGGSGGSNSGYIASTSYIDTGLSANHQYGYRVHARDGAGNPTASSGVSYDYTDIEAPNGIAFGAFTATSIQVQSINTPSGLALGSSGLLVQNSTTGANSGWKQNNDFWLNSGLDPNVQYTYRAMARNGDADPTSWSGTSSRFTLAMVPAAAAFSDQTQVSVQANWGSNTNPGGTEYWCENTTAGTNSGWITGNAWQSDSLTCATSYSFQVKARNFDGAETAWVPLGTVETLPCVPPCEGNFDGDHDVDLDDLNIFSLMLGNTCSGCVQDFDGDGDVDGLDLSVFAEDANRTDCP